jgi:hypothetical protein
MVVLVEAMMERAVVMMIYEAKFLNVDVDA